MRGELKKYQLRATNRASRQTLLASTVRVKRPDGAVGYCYINFSDEFETFVGKSLQFGISAERPAFIEVNFKEGAGYEVFARYVRDPNVAALLWVSKDKPEWLNFHKPRKRT